MNGVEFLRVGLQQASPTEFIEHPDFRQISTFFLGWTFFAAIHYMLTSPFATSLCLRLSRSHISSEHTHVGAEPRWSEKGVQRFAETSSSTSEHNDRVTIDLIFVLTLCIGLASLAQFISLLSFNPEKGDTACAFVTAWSGMAGQSARILGLLKTTLDMKSLGTSLLERLALWLWLSIGLIFIFATNAINIGTIQTVPQLDSLAFCYRRRFLPVSLVASLIYITTELYLMVRLMSLLAPHFLKLKHRLSVLNDVRFGRVTSLLTLDILTIVPQAIVVPIVAEVITYAIGALVVLFAFNYRTRVAAPSDIYSIPPTVRGSSGHFSSVREAEPEPGSALQRSPESSLRFIPGPRGKHRSTALSLPPNPYVTGAVREPPGVDDIQTPQFSIQTIETLDSDRGVAVRRSNEFPHSVRVSTTSTESAVAQSVKGAKISFAFRNKPSSEEKGAEYQLSGAYENNPTLGDVLQNPTNAEDLRRSEADHSVRPPPLVLRRYNPRQSELRSSRYTISESSNTADNGHTASSEDRHPYSPNVISPNDRRDSAAPVPITRIGAPSPVEDEGVEYLNAEPTREKRTTFGEAAFSALGGPQELPPLPVQEITGLSSSSNSPHTGPATPSTPRPKGPRPRRPSGGNF